MPHVILKLATGRSETIKQQLADAMTQSLVDIAGADAAQVSVAIEDIDIRDWRRLVYEPIIAPALPGLYRRPGYRPEDLPE
ncbi:4-oxalocrotonate tautomerase [Kushneria avicenniae]|uniref:4-oxalocrotonate tautomerase n=1 Tax=Kushneria avicenniae TaxID=402385 RepID=A0A1I1GAL0_9GAMM|nr:tautomerase family protein [Kushneria avicenniae]SFC06373.1 4-oxalocrotonate tautomerase [Kushneria avicenniae]